MEFTSKRAYLLLALNPNQQLESLLNRFALGRYPAQTHRAGHQTIVDYDIGSHPCFPDVYTSGILYTWLTI
jgi:hypothetical protein